MIDAKEEMKEEVIRLALKDLSKTSNSIFNEITENFKKRMMDSGKPYESLTRNQIIGLVNYTRNQQSGGDVFRAIEKSPSATLPDSSINFFSFNITRVREGMIKTRVD